MKDSYNILFTTFGTVMSETIRLDGKHFSFKEDAIKYLVDEVGFSKQEASKYLHSLPGGGRKMIAPRM